MPGGTKDLADGYRPADAHDELGERSVSHRVSVTAFAF